MYVLMFYRALSPIRTIVLVPIHGRVSAYVGLLVRQASLA